MPRKGEPRTRERLDKPKKRMLQRPAPKKEAMEAPDISRLELDEGMETEKSRVLSDFRDQVRMAETARFQARQIRMKVNELQERLDQIPAERERLLKQRQELATAYEELTEQHKTMFESLSQRREEGGDEADLAQMEEEFDQKTLEKSSVFFQIDRLDERLEMLGNEEAELPKQQEQYDQFQRYWVSQGWLSRTAFKQMQREYGLSLDKAWWEDIEERKYYLDFKALFDRLAQTEREVANYEAPIEMEATERKTGKQSRGDKRIAAIAADMWATQMPAEQGESLMKYLAPLPEEEDEAEEWQADLMEFLEEMYPEEDAQAVYAQMVEDAQERRAFAQLPKEEQERLRKQGETPMDEMPGTLAELRRQAKLLEVECRRLWEETEHSYDIQKRWFEDVLMQVIQQYHDKEKVIDIPTTIGYLNEIHKIRKRHKNSVIGAVLTGPPGVGKSTIIEHYLEKIGRVNRDPEKGPITTPLYLDMSENVNEYTIIGMPDVTLEEPIDKYTKFMGITGDLSDEQLLLMLSRQSERMHDIMGGDETDRKAVLIGTLMREIGEMKGSGELSADAVKQLNAVKSRLHQIAENAFVDEASKKLYDLTRKNGWRDGILSQAIRYDRDIIIDEFNMSDKYSYLHRLLESAPGDTFQLPTGENLKISKDWRCWFTGNVGAMHGSRGVKPAVMSRIKGAYLEMNAPTEYEEYMVMLAGISNVNGMVCRSEADVNRLGILIEEGFKTVRELQEKEGAKPTYVPISFRTIRTIAETLFDMDTQTAVPESIDTAIFNEVVRPLMITGDAGREYRVNVTKALLELGLLTDPAIEEEVARYAELKPNSEGKFDAIEEARALEQDRDHKKAIKDRKQSMLTSMTANMKGMVSMIG